MSFLNRLKRAQSTPRRKRRVRPIRVDSSKPVFRPIEKRHSEVMHESGFWESDDHSPRLPSYIVKYREQKKCSYCKHPIDKDPYDRDQQYWLYYLLLGIIDVIENIVHFFKPKAQPFLNFKREIMLPGWFRCKNTRCGQLYHANCWYHLKENGGCSRCHMKRANRVA